MKDLNHHRGFVQRKVLKKIQKVAARNISLEEEKTNESEGVRKIQKRYFS